MKQFSYEFNSVSQIDSILSNINEDIESLSYNALLFHIYTMQFNDKDISLTLLKLRTCFPEAYIGGTSSNGDICDGHFVDKGMVISLSVFESSAIGLKLFECEPGQEVETGQNIKEYIDNCPGIKAAEILITLKTINSQKVLSQVEKCNETINVFGGGSAAQNISDSDTRVFDSNTISKNGILIITYSGENFYIDIHHSIGWKPLGKKLTVTKIEGKRLYELDNIPAGKIYSKYLDIQADDNFFNNILEFPLLSTQHGYDVLRLPYECLKEDDSINLAAYMDEGTPVNLSYGDPEVIKEDVQILLQKTKKFAPEALFLYSCGVRRLYWKHLINKETAIFNSVAPVTGFYSSGEIMRMDNFIIEHHVTLIAVGMREGPPKTLETTYQNISELPTSEEEKMHSQISMVRRLANFINVTSSELMEANLQLQEIADTDELTGMYNRRMLDKLAYDSITRANKYNLNLILGIVDIDDFKEINDTYGHVAGDTVLQILSKAMYNEVEKLPSAIFGRWGGEEFLFIAPQQNLDDMIDKIEIARQRISTINIENIGIRTISVGVTSFIPGDTIQSIFERADSALYEAKNTGKNKVCRK